MFSIDSLFSSKNKPHSANISSYPSRQYKQVLCSRPHCTEACMRPAYDPYKYWALFFTARTINREDLLAHLNTLPERMRHAVYLHILTAKTGLQDQPKLNDQFNRYAQIGGAQESKPENGEEHPDLQISKDSQLVRDIIGISGFFAYEHPEAAFGVYRSLEDRYPLKLEVVKLIIPLLSLHGADYKSVYNIVDCLIRCHGLLEGLGVRIETSGPSPGRSDASEVQDDQAGEKEHVAASNAAEPPDCDAESVQAEAESTAFSAYAPTARVMLDDKTISAVWTVVLDEKIDIFFQMTDLVISLGCTYNELISRAAEVSLYTSPQKIVAVLSSKNNNHHYGDLIRPDRPEHYKKAGPVMQTYFDFLIVQNELIKGQENIKQQLSEQIGELEEENQKLKNSNEKLKEAMAQIKQQLARHEEHSA